MAAIPPSHSMGTLYIETSPLKASLRAEGAAWKAQFAKNLHKKGLDDLQVRLQQCLSHSASGLRLYYQRSHGRLMVAQPLPLHKTAHHTSVPCTDSSGMLALSAK